MTISPESKAIPEPPPRPWWHPARWAGAVAEAWLQVWYWVCGRRWPALRHRHLYRLIAATAAAPGTFAAAMASSATSGTAGTVLAYRCYGCRDTAQLQFLVVPGRWAVDELCTPGYPALVSVARQRELEEIEAGSLVPSGEGPAGHTAKMGGF
jgi:hypothetical protein